MKHTTRFATLVATLTLLLFSRAQAELNRMPVKEITVFKDGHALLLHEGSVAADKDGNVTLDYLPNPVLGTFWPFADDPSARLVSTGSSQQVVSVQRTALALRELIEANIGAEVTITELPLSSGRPDGMPATAPATYDATIVSIPEQSTEELRTTDPDAVERLPVKGNVVLLKTAKGTKVVGFDRIADVTFKSDPKSKLGRDEFRNVLTLKLAWKDKPKETARVGMLYLQKGIRWIPEYKVTIDGSGKATIKLQATLLNELTDLTDVTANLVIGVPSFAFKETADPIALQQAVAQLSTYFQANAQTANMMSNAIMTQQAGARMGERAQAEPAAPGQPPMNLGPEVQGAGKTEDLFVFTLQHVTLKKGQRLVIPVTEFSLAYKDVYTLQLPFLPPADVMRSFDSNRQGELARMLAAPKATHKIRLTNDSSYPLTTAPALVLRGDRVIAQGMMTYTPVGSQSDLDLTTAVNVRVEKTEREMKRTPNAERWNGDDYVRIDLTGSVKLTNYSDKPVDLEVTRYVLGMMDSASDKGEITTVSTTEDPDAIPPGGYPNWWSWYPWPWWFSHFNPVSQVTWNQHIEPGKPVELSYAWHYYWR